MVPLFFLRITAWICLILFGKTNQVGTEDATTKAHEAELRVATTYSPSHPADYAGNNEP